MTGPTQHCLGENFRRFMPEIDGRTALAGAMPIQTKPAITAVLNTMVRIELAFNTGRIDGKGAMPCLQLLKTMGSEAFHRPARDIVCRPDRKRLPSGSNLTNKRLLHPRPHQLQLLGALFGVPRQHSSLA